MGRLNSQYPDKYLKNDRERKRKERNAMKASKTKYGKYRANNRKVHSLSTLSSPQASSPNKSFPSKLSFDKVKTRAARGLPKSFVQSVVNAVS